MLLSSFMLKPLIAEQNHWLASVSPATTTKICLACVHTPSFSVSHHTGVWTWPDFIHLTGMSHVYLQKRVGVRAAGPASLPFHRIRKADPASSPL